MNNSLRIGQLRATREQQRELEALGYQLYTGQLVSREAYIHQGGQAVEISLGGDGWLGWRDYHDIAEEPLRGPGPVDLARQLLEDRDDA